MSVSLSTDEVVEEVTGLPSLQQDFLKEAAKNDLFVLCKGILNYKDINPPTHGAFCRFIQDEEKQRRLGLMPRTHLKTTIASVGDSIRLVLKDPDETRILISGETALTAEKILTEIKGHWIKNKLLRALFSDLLPTRLAGPGVQWSSNIASLNRSRDYKEGNWNTVGVGGAVVGSHFNRIKCDDLIGLEAFNSPAAMRYAISWVSNIEPLLINQHSDIIDFIGTRWSRQDLYNFIMKYYGDRMAVFTRTAIEDGKIIFPQKHTMEGYQTMQRETPHVWFSQYQNNPLAAGISDFPNPQTFYFDNEGRVVLLRGNDRRIWRLDQLDKILTADPNSGAKTATDPAAISVSGVTPDDDIVTLDSWSGRLSPSEFVDKIFEKAKHWKVRVAGIEQAGQQNTAHYFEKKQESEDFYVRILPLKPKGRDKIQRIRDSLEPIIRSGRLYVLATQTELRRMISEFPDTHPIDELDALAYGKEDGMWRRPYREEDLEANTRALKLVVSRRNRRTGY